MIESAQAILGGIKENSQSSKVPEQIQRGMKKNPKDPKVLSKKNKNKYDDAQNHMKKTKTKRISPSPTQEGTIDNFRKTVK